MPIAREHRDQYFTDAIVKHIASFNIRRGRSSDFMSAVRIGYLCSNLALKMYSVELAQDALIEFRDWAYKARLVCDQIDEVEIRGGKKIKNPYANPSRRLYPNLSFIKYIKIFEEILTPPRQPLFRREPVCLAKT